MESTIKVGFVGCRNIVLANRLVVTANSLVDALTIAANIPGISCCVAVVEKQKNVVFG